MRPFARMSAFVLVLAVTPSLLAQIEIETLEGRHVGDLASIDGTAISIVVGGKQVTVPLVQVVSIHQPGSDQSAGLVRFDLLGGDRYFGTLVQCDGLNTLVIDSPSCGRVELRGELLVGIEYPMDRKDVEKLPPPEAVEGDAIFLRNGDRVRGQLEDLTAREGGAFRYRIKTGDEVQEIDDLRVWRVKIVPVESFTPSGEFHAVVRCWDGTSLAARLKGVVDRTLVLDSIAGGLERKIPFGAIASILFMNGSFVYVPDLTPLATDHVPYIEDANKSIELRFEPRMNQCQRGGPLVLRGRTYRKGIGMQVRTRMDFDATGFAKFRCQVGIDDCAGDGGSVVFRVLLDGKKVKETGILRGGGEVETLSIDLKGAKVLSLEVDHADNSHVNDQADWVDPILVR